MLTINPRPFWLTFITSKPWVIVIVAVIVCGCATLNIQSAAVHFVDPIQKLNIQEVEPSESEQQGVLLRLIPFEGQEIRANEDIVMFESINEGEGLRLELNKKVKERYSQGSSEDSYILQRRSTFDNFPGDIFEEYETTTRGEIIRFINGYHNAKTGKFRILKWTRSPFLPEKPVRIGDSWKYEEVMDVQLESFWVKQENSIPYTLQASIQLVGFALVNGKRCAVLKIVASMDRKEHLKIAFKEFILNSQSYIDRTMYLNYNLGQIVAEISHTHTFTINQDLNFGSTGKSQSIYYLEASRID